MKQLSVEKNIMREKAIESGYILVKMMNKYKRIGVLRKDTRYSSLICWVESLFNYFEYKQARLELTSYENADNYDALIVIELNMGTKNYDLIYKETDSQNFGLKKNLPTVYLNYNLMFTDEEKSDAMDYIYNGASILKSREKYK